MLKIDIISGFLGAGKTTFIKRLLQTDLKNEKIVLIENEFGEISVDSLFLSEDNINIAELSQGCICCSLVGDFAQSLNEVIAKYNPNRIIVEPSGVGKLSDVLKAIEDAGLSGNLNTYVCLVDASKAKVYSKNFKEFFADQIEHAKTVILSRCDIVTEEKVQQALDVVRHINSDCNVITTPISELSDELLLSAYEGQKTSILEELMDREEHHHHHDEECCHHHEHHHDEECCCHHEHHHHHDEECCCHHHEHHHHADEVFNSVSIETPKVYCFTKLQQVLNELANTTLYGEVIRAKGIVKTTDGWKKFNITPNELIIEDNTPLIIGSICVIGVHLDPNVIKGLF